jgi:hypothetical protein
MKLLKTTKNIPYNKYMLNRIKPPYIEIEYKLRPIRVVGGKNIVPDEYKKNLSIKIIKIKLNYL